MKKIIIIAAFVLCMVAPNAYALSVSAEGGLYAPLGGYKDTFNVGYTYGVSIYQKIFPFTSLKATYYHYSATGKKDVTWANPFASSSTRLEGDAGELTLRFSPFKFVVEPYIAAGGGYYSNKIKSKASNYTQDGFGFVAEAGLSASFYIFSIGLNARYTNSNVSGGGHSTTVEGVTAGLLLTVNIPLT